MMQFEGVHQLRVVILNRTHLRTILFVYNATLYIT
jgi:hypothetical protein